MLTIQVLLCLLAIAASHPVKIKQRLEHRRGWAPPTAAPTTSAPTTAAPTTAAPTTAAPATPVPTLPPPGYEIVALVTGTFPGGGLVNGHFYPGEFNYEQGQLTVTGVLQAVLTRVPPTPTNVGNVNPIATLPSGGLPPTPNVGNVPIATLPSGGLPPTPTYVGNVNQIITMPVVLPNANGGPSTPGVGGVGGARRLLQILPTLPATSLPGTSTNNSSNSNSSDNNSTTGSGGSGGSGGAGSALCDVLNLNLQAPTDLSLLGLLVHLNPVLLTVKAQPGGGILGNLLCSISGLLPSLPGLGDLQTLGGLGQVSNLFNSVLDILDLAQQPTQNLAGLDQVTSLLTSLVGLLSLVG